MFYRTSRRFSLLGDSVRKKRMNSISIENLVAGHMVIDENENRVATVLSVEALDGKEPLSYKVILSNGETVYCPYYAYWTLI